MIYPKESVIRSYINKVLPDFIEKSNKEFVGPAKGYEQGEHFWINAGTGLWQDFKNKEAGNFWQLVCYIEECTFQEASRRMLRNLFGQDIKDCFTAVENKNVEYFEPRDFFKELDLVPITKDSLESDPRMFRVRDFLRKRKIENTLVKEYPLYLSIGYDYPNTIIIPFIEDGKMIFFQARSLDPNAKAKYLTPDSEKYKVRAANILYPFLREDDYETSSKILYIFEGPLKARLAQVEFCCNATSTQSASMSLQQARIIKARGVEKIIIAYDNDTPGIKGARKVYKLLVNRLGYPSESILFLNQSKYFKTDLVDIEDIYSQKGYLEAANYLGDMLPHTEWEVKTRLAMGQP